MFEIRDKLVRIKLHVLCYLQSLCYVEDIQLPTKVKEAMQMQASHVCVCSSAFLLTVL